MDDTYAQLATSICSAARAKSPPGSRLLVGIAGPPGSGKTTIAQHVVRIINNTQTSTTSSGGESPLVAKTVSVDGFHYTRRYLDTLPNREEAYVRRGAPWTFDVDAILALVSRLAATASLPSDKRPTILAPSFDHALKDPVEDDIEISPETSIVILDGNYLLLDEDKWRDISPRLDLRIFVQVDPQLARDRVAARHVAAGIEPTLEKGLERFDSNDLINGDLIRSKIVGCDLKVESIPIPVAVPGVGVV
jgi:pantothenate kinase